MAGVNPRDNVPLLLRSLLDRGPRIQSDNLIITKVEGGSHTMTFGEHSSRSKRLASALAKAGIKIGDVVGTLMWNSTWHLHCYHGISCMGAIMHTLNLRLGPKDLGYIIEHASDRFVICDADMLELLAQVDDTYLNKVELVVAVGTDCQPGKWQAPGKLVGKTRDFEEFLMSGSDGFLWPDLLETTTHAICYTSGTTGNPKGAAYSHRSTYLHTLASAGTDQLGISGSEVVLPFVPMFHVLSWGVPFVLLMLGTRTVFNSRFMDPGTLLDLMTEWKVSFSTGVPTVWQGVRALIDQRGVEKVRPALKLRMLTCGGSAPPAEMMQWYGEKLGVEFLQGWGMTETNPLGSFGRRIAKHKDLSKSDSELFANIKKAGLPCTGVDVRIADPDNLDNDLPNGKPGELLVRGPWIIAEYYKHPAPDKFHKGWLITGDIALLDEEGAIIISDRSKDVVKSGGEWISSIDLENTIAAMKEIAMACVVAMPHPKWDERPVAIVTIAPGVDGKGLLERVHEHCSKDFAKFQLPDDVLVWDSIPLTSTGKLDKKVVRDKLNKQGYVLPSLQKSKL